MKRYGFITAFLLILFSQVFFISAQEPRKTTRVDLLHAQDIRFSREIAPDARRLIGDVQFRHEDATMRCDSAWQFTVDNRFNAYGNVHIKVNDSVDVYGDRLFYDGNTRMAELQGNVRMVDKQMTLTTDHLFYNLNTNTANYNNGGKIVGTENTLTSRWGFYYANENDFFFKDQVVLVNPDYTMNSDTLKYNTQTEIAFFHGPTTIVSDENTIFCLNGWYDTQNDIARFSKDAFFTNGEQFLSGDSLYYDRNLGYGKAVMNVLLHDSVQQTWVTGHFAEHFEHEGLTEITINTLLRSLARGDTMYLHADTLRSIHDEENNRRAVFAWYNAKIFKSDLQGMADSIVYNFADSTIYLYNNPVIWSGDHQLTARRIEVKTSENRRVDAIHLFDAAFIVSREDSTSFNQIKGKKIIAHFIENDIHKIDVFGNGEALYFVRDDHEQLIGINKSISSDITIYIDDGQVSSIVLLAESDANLFPPADLPQDDRFLQNFSWITDRRPMSKDDVFIW